MQRIMAIVAALAPPGCPSQKTDTADTGVVLERLYGRCGEPDEPSEAVILPEGAEIERVTVYGVEHIGGNEYEAVEEDIGTYTRAADIVIVTCPDTGSDWQWRSFNVWYWG